jgi:hypothetical protein
LLSSPQLYSSSRSHPGCLHSFMRFHNFKFHQQTHWLGMRVNDGKISDCYWKYKKLFPTHVIIDPYIHENCVESQHKKHTPSKQ